VKVSGDGQRHRATGKPNLKLAGSSSFFKILFVLLEITQFKAPDGSENGKWIKIDLTRSSPGPSFVLVFGRNYCVSTKHTFGHDLNGSRRHHVLSLFTYISY
jgi:hypothetical protein